MFVDLCVSVCDRFVCLFRVGGREFQKIYIDLLFEVYRELYMSERR